MTTTDWTAVGRRLSVRRTPNRPPWRGRKPGHGSILLPLTVAVTATLAASAAVGVGMALAKAERDRRGARARHARGRKFALWPEEGPAQGLRRMALEQLDLAIELLEGDQEGVLADNAVHETRKSLKRLRALIRLLAGELGEEEAARENAVLRDAARRLAVTRDTEVLVGTLDDLLVRNPIELGHRPGVAALRARLDSEREAAAEAALGETATRSQVIAELRAARWRITEWQLTDREGIGAVEPGLGRIYRQGRRRQRRAARGEGDRAGLMHMWRKRVKDLRYASEMLDRFDPGEGHVTARRSRTRRWRVRRRRRAETQTIRRTARWADELGELLGDEHDLVLLAARIIAEGEGGTSQPRPESDEEATDSASDGVDNEDASVQARGLGEVVNVGAAGGGDAKTRAPGAGDASVEAACGEDTNAGAGGAGDSNAQAAPAAGADNRVDEGTRRILLKLIEERRRRLRKEALRRGERLYRRKPKRFVARMRDAYERAANR